ncbi:uncharacterized protein NEMAJ01_2406, partial [Nematocida major]|uniref:uncharacterized protein n=1 Tax=Nematocida major TaxID=1912982 RepID=UPI00200898E7
YTLDRIFEKVRAYCSNDECNRSVYFGLKELTENNGKYIRAGQIEALEKQRMNSKDVFSVKGMAEKLRIEEKERISMGETVFDCGCKMNAQVRRLVEFGYVYFADVVNHRSTFEIVCLLYTVKNMMKKLQEPEKTEMEEFLKVLKELYRGIISHRATSIKGICRIKNGLNIDNLLDMLLDAYVRNNFVVFNDSFRKIQEKFPNGEIKSGYNKAFQTLKNHPRTKKEMAKRMHDNAMEAEEHLTRLRGVDEGTTRKDCDLRVAEYEKFARETEMPDSGYSGAIENITRES